MRALRRMEGAKPSFVTGEELQDYCDVVVVEVSWAGGNTIIQIHRSDFSFTSAWDRIGGWEIRVDRGGETHRTDHLPSALVLIVLASIGKVTRTC